MFMTSFQGHTSQRAGIFGFGQVKARLPNVSFWLGRSFVLVCFVSDRRKDGESPNTKFIAIVIKNRC